MEPPPKATQRRKLSEQERLFRRALGILRYGSRSSQNEMPWLSTEAVLLKIIQQGSWDGKMPLTTTNLHAALELDPTRIEQFSWRDSTWVRAKLREPRVVLPPQHMRLPPGLSMPVQSRDGHQGENE